MQLLPTKEKRAVLFVEWRFCEQRHPLDNLALDRRVHAVGDWFSTRETWCGSADKVASEIAHTRAPASAGGTDHLA